MFILIWDSHHRECTYTMCNVDNNSNSDEKFEMQRTLIHRSDMAPLTNYHRLTQTTFSTTLEDTSKQRQIYYELYLRWNKHKFQPKVHCAAESGHIFAKRAALFSANVLCFKFSGCVIVKVKASKVNVIKSLIGKCVITQEQMILHSTVDYTQSARSLLLLQAGGWLSRTIWHSYETTWCCGWDSVPSVQHLRSPFLAFLLYSHREVIFFYFCDKFPNCKPIQITFGRCIAEKIGNRMTCGNFDIYSLCVASLS